MRAWSATSARVLLLGSAMASMALAWPPTEAGAQAARPTLEWTLGAGAEDCPTAADINAAVDALMGAPLAVDAATRVRGSITPAGPGRWRIELELIDEAGRSRGVRELFAQRQICASLRGELALVLSVMLTEVGGEVHLAAAEVGEPAEIVEATRETVHVSANAPLAPAPPTAPSTTGQDGLSFELGLQAAILWWPEAVMLPAARVRAPLSSKVQWTGALLGWPYAESEGSPGVALRGLIAEVGLCVTPDPASFRLELCAAMSGGALVARGIRVEDAVSEAIPFVGASTDAGLRWLVNHWLVVRSSVGVWAPFTRPELVVGGTGQVGQLGPLALRLEASIGVHFQ